MPPVDQTPQATIRYLTQIIAVLARKAGGSLHIKQSALRKIKEESFRLVEDVDDRKDEIVLRFDPKHAWMCVIEAECQPSQQRPAALPSVQPARNVNVASGNGKPLNPELPQPTTSLPFTEEMLARAEKKLAQMKMLHAIRKERSPTA